MKVYHTITLYIHTNIYVLLLFCLSVNGQPKRFNFSSVGLGRDEYMYEQIYIYHIYSCVYPPHAQLPPLYSYMCVYVCVLLFFSFIVMHAINLCESIVCARLHAHIYILYMTDPIICTSAILVPWSQYMLDIYIYYIHFSLSLSYNSFFIVVIYI